jgi:hypothetical protein
VRCSTAPWLSASSTAFVISSTNKNLGAERVWVVHDSDGLDEITTAGPTNVAALENGTVTSFEISPEEVGLHRVKSEYLRGGDAAVNAKALRGVAFRDVALFNAAAALVVAGKANTLKEGLDFPLAFMLRNSLTPEQQRQFNRIFSHAALCVRYGLFIEAIGPGVSRLAIMATGARARENFRQFSALRRRTSRLPRLHSTEF